MGSVSERAWPPGDLHSLIDAGVDVYDAARARAVAIEERARPSDDAVFLGYWLALQWGALGLADGPILGACERCERPAMRGDFLCRACVFPGDEAERDYLRGIT